MICKQTETNHQIQFKFRKETQMLCDFVASSFMALDLQLALLITNIYISVLLICGLQPQWGCEVSFLGGGGKELSKTCARRAWIQSNNVTAFSKLRY